MGGEGAFESGEGEEVEMVRVRASVCVSVVEGGGGGEEGGGDGVWLWVSLVVRMVVDEYRICHQHTGPPPWCSHPDNRDRKDLIDAHGEGRVSD